MARKKQPPKSRPSPTAKTPSLQSWTGARVAETPAVQYTSGGLRSIPAGEFKARCLELMDHVQTRHEQIVVTKHGMPVAKLVPYEAEAPDIVGFMKGSVLWYGDIVSPIDSEWEALADGE